MKNQALKDEVRKAVAAYVDGLIQKRTGNGNGCAVSAHDLLVAAKSAGQKDPPADFYVPIRLDYGKLGKTGNGVNRNEADVLLEQFVQPCLQIIKDSPRGEDKFVKKYNSGSHGNVVKPRPPGGKPRGAPPVKHRKDYHWMAWKTTPTPCPETPYPDSPVPPTPRPGTGARPGTGGVRPVSVPIPGPVTPAPPSPGIDIYSAPPSRAATIAGLPMTPAPGLREETPEIPLARVDTPASMRPDCRDPLASPQTVPVQQALAGVKENGNPQFVPALKAWVNNANDYEKDVAYSLLKCLNGGKSAGPARGQPVFNAANGAARLASRPRTAGVKTSVPVWRQSYSQPQREKQRLNALGKSIERQAQRPISTSSIVGTEIPMRSYGNRDQGYQGFTHQSSCFQNSQLPYRSNFVIHPEWVSEAQGLKAIKKPRGPPRGVVRSINKY